RAVARRSRAPQAELELGRMRKLGRAAEAAEARVEVRLQGAQRLLERPGRELRVVGRGTGLHALEGSEQGLVLPGDRVPVVAPAPRDVLEHLGKSRQVVALLLGEIGAAEKGRAFWREEHGERPAAGALREHLVRELVDLVEVRAFLAVDLDVDE